MKIIDTHAHLDHLEDLDQALMNAKDANVDTVIAVSEDLTSSQRNLEISQTKSNPRVYVAMGMHPSEAKRQALNNFKEFISANKERIVAIGEIGLDYWYQWVRKDVGKKQEQREVFQFFLNIAKELNLPVVIHSRGAWQECLQMTKDTGIAKAVFHWYSGPEDVLNDILAQGYLISVTPSLEYSAESQAAVAIAPIEKILIETDTPVYYRNRETNEGFRAEPKDVHKTLKLYCNLKKMDHEKAVAQFNANAKAFFNLERVV